MLAHSNTANFAEMDQEVASIRERLRRYLTCIIIYPGGENAKYAYPHMHTLRVRTRSMLIPICIP